MPPPVSASMVAQFARSWRGYVLIALIALVSAGFGASRMPALDGGEAETAQAARQVAESGDFLRIRLQDTERYAAPPGALWLQAGARMLWPVAESANTAAPHRFISALGLALAALAALWGGTPLIGRRAALYGAGLFAAGMLAGFAGMMASPAALYLGFLTLAFAALARLRRETAHRRRHALIFWVALACALLVKGFIVLLAPALTLSVLALWERRSSWMAPLAAPLGPLFALLIAAPWFIAIGLETNGRALLALFGALAPGAGAFIPPGYHLLLLAFLIFPASYALPAAARLAWEGARSRSDDEARAPLRFLIAWAAPLFVAAELAPTKHIFDALESYPAIALLCGAGLEAMRGRAWRTAHPAGLVLFGVAGIVLVALTALAATFMPGDFYTDARRAASAGLIGLGVVGLSLAALMMLRRPAARAGVMVVCALVLSFSLRERLLPEAREIHVSAEAVAALARARLNPRADRRLWVVGYSEMSLVFSVRGAVDLADAETMAWRAQPGDALIVEGRLRRAAEAALAAHGLAFVEREAPVRGWPPARGQLTALYIGEIVSDEPAGAPPQNP